MNPEERLLDDFPGIVFVPDQAEGDGERPPLVPFDQFSKGMGVAFFCLTDEDTILFGL